MATERNLDFDRSAIVNALQDVNRMGKDASLDVATQVAILAASQGVAAMAQLHTADCIRELTDHLKKVISVVGDKPLISVSRDADGS